MAAGRDEELLDSGVYVGVITSAHRPGALSRDVWMAVSHRRFVLCELTRCSRALLPALRLSSWRSVCSVTLFYAYSIYVIKQVYKAPYLDSMTMFGIAAWLSVLGPIDVVRRTADHATLARRSLDSRRSAHCFNR